MAYIGASPSNGIRRKYKYTATAAQTSFTNDDNGITVSYVDSLYVDVFQNGVKLAQEDYTSTTGTSVVLVQAASADDIIEIIVFDVFGVADTVSQSAGGSFSGVVNFSQPPVFSAGGVGNWQSVVTASTLTVVAGKGYPINTTSNACTVTLPSSASVGDSISIVDYAGTFNTNNITLTSSLNINGATDDKYLTTNREGIAITYVDVTQGWVATSGVNSGNQALDAAYSIDFLVIAGGASGGQENYSSGAGGGGGAGGYRTSTQTIIQGNTITITVGDGGASRPQGGGKGANGSDSSISGIGLTTITSAGGGGGGGGTNTGNSGSNAGGSGGGGTDATSPTGSAGNTPSTSPSQGNAGGNSYSDKAGGGGGASAVGANGTAGGGGAGGAGTASSITGTSETYAGGGGGSGASATGGAGGAGGGGIGARYQVHAAGSGDINTGGGGGGGANAGTPNYSATGAGGKGVIILSMPDSSYSGVSTGSPTVATGVSGKTILTFTGTGSYTS